MLNLYVSQENTNFNMTDWFLIVGLGNPGKKYEDTRHNVGWRALDELARKHGLTFDSNEHKSVVAKGTIAGERIVLAKPQTYMNRSGEAAQPLVSFYKVELPNILVVCDDIDIDLGRLKMRKSGSSGGQNGLKDIFQKLGTQDINRLRIGLSRPPGRMDPAAYVLQKFQGDDAILAAETIDRAVKAMESWLTDGPDIAMNRYNGSDERKSEPKPKKQPAVEQPAPPESND
jgi:PTH1 family peptidyl-tRNA hydrolase